MKQFFTAMMVMVALGTATAQHSRPATTKQTAKVVKVETHKKTMPATAQNDKKTQTVSAHSNVATIITKKDGTPDRRYKANQHLKKDGTPDRRYKTAK